MTTYPSDCRDAAEYLMLMRGNGRRARDLDFSHAKLARVDVSRLNADRLSLARADLSQAKLVGVRLSECQFENARVERADFTGAILRRCVFDSVFGGGASFSGARIEDSSLKAADLTSASLRAAKLTETSFERAVLHRAVFDDAEGVGVGFRGADLSEASLRCARFDEADFRGADLRNTDLSGGRFHNGDFRGALLDGASFEGADCMGALFDTGSGPDADWVKPHDQSKGSVDQTIGAMMQDCLSVLFANGGGCLEEVSDQVKRSLETFSKAADLSPDELRQWAESLIASAKRDPPEDIGSVIDALCKGPIELQTLAATDKASRDEIMERVRYLVQSLSSTGDQPPAWVKAMILGLRDEVGLEGTANAQEVLSRLLNPRGH